jgi:cell division protein ZapA
MALVNLTVNGRSYTVACDAGQEDRLRQLAQVLEKHVSALVGSVGQAGEARLLLMAGLVICDELDEAGRKIARLETEIAALKQREERASEALENAAERLEAIAGGRADT